jgi:hypothetical protein
MGLLIRSVAAVYASRLAKRDPGKETNPGFRFWRLDCTTRGTPSLTIEFEMSDREFGGEGGI